MPLSPHSSLAGRERRIVYLFLLLVPVATLTVIAAELFVGFGSDESVLALAMSVIVVLLRPIPSPHDGAGRGSGRGDFKRARHSMEYASLSPLVPRGEREKNRLLLFAGGAGRHADRDCRGVVRGIWVRG